MALGLCPGATARSEFRGSFRDTAGSCCGPGGPDRNSLARSERECCDLAASADPPTIAALRVSRVKILTLVLLQAEPAEAAWRDLSASACDLAASADPPTTAALRVARATSSALALVQAVPAKAALRDLSANTCDLAARAVPLVLVQAEPAEAAATDTLLASCALADTQVAPAPPAFADLRASTRVLAETQDHPVAAVSRVARVKARPLALTHADPRESPSYVDAAMALLVAALHAAPAIVRSRERLCAVTIAPTVDLEAERTARATLRAARLPARALRSRFSRRRCLACSRLSERRAASGSAPQKQRSP